MNQNDNYGCSYIKYLVNMDYVEATQRRGVHDTFLRKATKIYDIVVLSVYCHWIVASYAPYYHNLGEVHNKIVYFLVNQ